MARREKSPDPTQRRNCREKETRSHRTSKTSHRRFLRKLQQPERKGHSPDKVSLQIPPRLRCRNEEQEFLAARDNEGGGTAWERIAKYVDISDKNSAGSGPTRYRELLLSLKNDANAPSSQA
jgi:Clathrin light chain